MSSAGDVLITTGLSLLLERLAHTGAGAAGWAGFPAEGGEGSG